jgi:hypothetical protein
MKVSPRYMRVVKTHADTTAGETHVGAIVVVVSAAGETHADTTAGETHVGAIVVVVVVVVCARREKPTYTTPRREKPTHTPNILKYV